MNSPNITVQAYLVIGLASLLAGALAAAASGVAGFYLHYLFHSLFYPPRQCGQVGCWEGLLYAAAAAPIGALAAPVLTWKLLTRRLQKRRDAAP